MWYGVYMSMNMFEKVTKTLRGYGNNRSIEIGTYDRIVKEVMLVFNQHNFNLDSFINKSPRQWRYREKSPILRITTW